MRQCTSGGNACNAFDVADVLLAFSFNYNEIKTLGWVVEFIY